MDLDSLREIYGTMLWMDTHAKQLHKKDQGVPNVPNARRHLCHTLYKL